MVYLAGLPVLLLTYQSQPNHSPCEVVGINMIVLTLKEVINVTVPEITNEIQIKLNKIKIKIIH